MSMLILKLVRCSVDDYQVEGTLSTSPRYILRFTWDLHFNICEEITKYLILDFNRISYSENSSDATISHVERLSFYPTLD